MSVDKITKYIITDGTNFVNNSNAKTVCQNSNDAYMWSLKVSAENVLKDAKNRNANSDLVRLDSKYHIEEVCLYRSDVPNDIISDIKVIADFADIVRDSAEREEDLLSQLSKIDRELSDIEHYIEFVDLNGVDGFKVYKKMQSLRQFRREIKYRLKIMHDINSQSIDPDVLKRLCSFFKDLYYRPKVVDFDDILKE